MNRELDPVVSRARDVLEPILDRLGFALASECYSPDAFGSVNTEYRRRGHRLELVWDGKDRWLWFKVAPSGSNGVVSPESWRDLEGELRLIPEGQFIQPGLSAETRINQLASALQQFFHLGPAI
jgi:hypothetical protein